MRLDVNVHLHDPRVSHLVEAFNTFKETFMALSAKLQAAIDNVNARLEQTNTELDAIATALDNQDAVTAAAVAKALADAGVDEDKAADLITTASNTVREHIDAVFAKVGVTPPPTNGTGGGDAQTDPDPGTGGQETTTDHAEPFAITTTSLPDAVTGQDYTGVIEFVNGTAPFTITNAPLTENGFTVDSEGFVSGAGLGDGDFTFSLSAQDASDPPQTATGSVNLHSASAPVDNQ